MVARHRSRIDGTGPDDLDGHAAATLLAATVDVHIHARHGGWHVALVRARSGRAWPPLDDRQEAALSATRVERGRAGSQHPGLGRRRPAAARTPRLAPA